jgi:hypothetical protein
MLLDQRSLLAPVKLTTQLLKRLQQHLANDNPQQQQQQQQQQQLTEGLDTHAAVTAAASAAFANDAAITGAKAAAATGSSHGSSGGSSDGGNADGDSIVWRQVYLGSSASSICSGMTAGQLRHFFHEAALCIRSYNPLQGSVSLRLPAYLTPQHT